MGEKKESETRKDSTGHPGIPAGKNLRPCGEIDVQGVLGRAVGGKCGGESAEFGACLFPGLSAVHVVPAEYEHVTCWFQAGQDHRQVRNPCRYSLKCPHRVQM